MPHARPGKVLQHRRADPAEPDQRDPRARQRDLPRAELTD
jgi:hypothetical protein